LHGVLGQAKNGDQLFWEEKFHAADVKAQTCTQGAYALANGVLLFTYIPGPKWDLLFWEAPHLISRRGELYYMPMCSLDVNPLFISMF
jgi:hypothetical protein